MTGQRAFVTIADSRFGKGAVALARSLARQSDRQLICVDLGIEAGDRTELERIGVEMRAVEPLKASFADPEWAPSLTKLRLIGWEGFERLGYLDADTIVLGPVDELLEIEGPLAACPDYGIRLSDELFNAGVMSIAPSPATERELLDLIESLGDDYWATDRSDPRWLERHPSDQGLLNLAYRDRWQRLDPAFNVSKRLLVHHPELWAALRPRLRVLHFIGHKPWWPASDTERERGYEELEELWWKEYEG